MEVEAIWKAMLYEINDIDVLKDACQNNEIADKICAQQSFWIKYFQKNSISMFDINYETSSQWIEEFIFTKIKSKETDVLANYLYKNKDSAIGLYYWIDIQSDYSFLSLIDRKNNIILNQYLVKNNGKRIKIKITFDGKYWLLNYDGTIIFRLLLLDAKRYIFQLLYNNYILYPLDQLI